MTLPTYPNSVFWELSKDIVRKDIYPGKNIGKMAPLGTKSVLQSKNTFCKDENLS
jgi:hypothetical protein